MRQIDYDGSRWLVGNDAASALVDLAVALARSGSAQSVTLAALSTEGEAEELTLLVGPATMMASESFATEWDEPDNEDAVASVRRAIEQLGPVAVVPTDEPIIRGLDEF